MDRRAQDSQLGVLVFCCRGNQVKAQVSEQDSVGHGMACGVLSVNIRVSYSFWGEEIGT